MNILEYENYHEEVDHAGNGIPYNTYLCSIPLDFNRVPLHWHDEMEIIYIKKGQGLVTVDFTQYRVSAGCILLIIPGQLHEILQEGPMSMEYENILFQTEMLLSKKTDVTGAEFIRPLLEGKLKIPTVYTPDQRLYRAVSGPIDACDDICSTMPKGYQLVIKSKLFELFYILCTQCVIREDSSKISTPGMDKLKVVLKYVENNYGDKITIETIAKVAGFSESHFMRYFKDTMGTSFIDYLNEYRLTMAARLLQSSESSIISIADEVGFENPSYFNRAFKKHFGTTPSAYRKSE